MFFLSCFILFSWKNFICKSISYKGINLQIYSINLQIYSINLQIYSSWTYKFIVLTYTPVWCRLMCVKLPKNQNIGEQKWTLKT